MLPSASRRVDPRAALTAVLEIIALVALVILFAAPARAQVGGIALGTPAPSAMVETLDGRAIDLASYAAQGKPVVLEFWATWCPLCRRLEPTMAAARAKYDGQVTFVSVGVSGNQTPERQRAHAEQNKMTGLFVFDRDDHAQKAYSALHTSYVVVLDAKGVVVYTGMGDTQDIDAAVRKGLAASMP